MKQINYSCPNNESHSLKEISNDGRFVIHRCRTCDILIYNSVNEVKFVDKDSNINMIEDVYTESNVEIDDDEYLDNLCSEVIRLMGKN